MPLKSRNVFPPGGWQFFQAETGWKLPGGKTFTEAVQAIIAHRRANPRFNFSLGADAVADLLDTFTCYRINFDENYCNPPVEAQKKTSSLKPLPPPSEKPSPSVPPASKPSFLARLAGLADGARIISEWLGDGGEPVHELQSEDRALVCELCPMNNGISGFDKVTGAVAEAIKEQMIAKNQGGFTVHNEDRLGMCGVCRCYLPLKVHVPIGHIENNTPQNVRNLFPGNCWIPKEFTAGNSTKAQSGAS